MLKLRLQGRTSPCFMLKNEEEAGLLRPHCPGMIQQLLCSRVVVTEDPTSKTLTLEQISYRL